ncbi:MAG: Mrp/NBP35 family ATP-binding protein, partial [Desulfobacterales bacterium]|nr:Mrp/NBP35 family ATP-binding protein [Desulfobacterales bacterium]
AGFKCPHCDDVIHLFGEGGGKKTADATGLNFLGSIPFDTQVVSSGDDGKPLMLQGVETEFTKAFKTVVDNIKAQL